MGAVVVMVSREAAVVTCEQVRKANARRVFSVGHWQCWGCMRFGGEPEKRCMRSPDGWDACPQVNREIAARDR
jgi:hypothetical protein